MNNIFNNCKKVLFNRDYKLQIFAQFGYSLDLDNSRTFDEKLNSRNYMIEIENMQISISIWL